MKSQLTNLSLTIFLLLLNFFISNAGEVVHIGTADKNVIVVEILTEPGEEIPTQVAGSWSVNGVTPSEVGRYTYVWYQEKEPSNMSHKHHMYLRMPFPLLNGTSYTIKTPAYGIDTLLFNDMVTQCESVHANQVGYFGGAEKRYANFGIFMGDLGTRFLTEIPGYKVLNAVGETIKSGTITYWGDDTGLEFETGEYAYRIDLAGLPDGGPYVISVEGYGCSFPFGVGPDYINQISYINIRGLFHQRCGMALEEPYTEFTHGVCHDIVEITETDPPVTGDGLITTRGPEMAIAGGYHDAGDYDRRDSHPLVPSWMLALYEAYPDAFTDGQYNIPESGNGIPDWLDECLWGLKVWEYLQESDGGIRGGIEAESYPPYGSTPDADELVYKTYKRYGVTTSRGAGLFAYASRMVKPFDESRASELLQRAVNAWNYLQENSMPTAYDAPMMYAALQLYLATENQAYHDIFKTYANRLLAAPVDDEPYKSGVLGGRTTIFGPYFFSYLLTDLPKDQDIVDGFTQVVSGLSDKWLGRLASMPYPIVTIPDYGWGRASAQGMFAEPLIYMYRLTGDQKYLEGISEMANYTLGQNPLNRTYITGLGARPPIGTRNHNTYHFFKEGKGTIPGITVYGLISEPAANRARVQKRCIPNGPLWVSKGDILMAGNFSGQMNIR